MTDFWIDIGITVILRLLADGKIPQKFVKGLIKLRDRLNFIFPPESGEKLAKGTGVKIVK